MLQSGGRNIKWILLAFVIITSCTRTIDVKLPPHVPSLVLHSYMDIGELFKASLGKTISSKLWVPDTGTYVKNGWMTIYEDGIFLDSLHYDSMEDKYIATHAIAKLGKTYRIMAGAPDFATVEASASAPQPVSTIGLNHLKNARSDVSGMPLDDITFSFMDPENEKNFYLSALFPGYPGISYPCVYTYDPSVEKYTEGLLPFDQNSCIFSQEIMYTDKSFNGKLKQITLSTNSYTLEPYVEPWTGDTLKPYLKRFSISEEYYRYFRNTYTLYLNSGGPTLSDPIIIKGNVKNGYGLFTIFTSVTDTLP